MRFVDWEGGVSQRERDAEPNGKTLCVHRVAVTPLKSSDVGYRNTTLGLTVSLLWRALPFLSSSTIDPFRPAPGQSVAAIESSNKVALTQIPNIPM